MQRPVTHPAVSLPTVHPWPVATVEVAWRLLRAGHPPGSPWLGPGRQHVLLSLDEGLPADALRPAARLHAAAFVERIVARRVRRVDFPPPAVPVDPGWRTQVTGLVDGWGRAVFELVHGEGWTLEEVAAATGWDAGGLAAAREGLRAAVAEVVGRAGHPPPRTPSGRDRLLERLASLPAAGCGLAAGRGLAVPDPGCPLCRQARRLLEAGWLGPEDLVPGPGAEAQPPRIEVLALHLHPAARRHRETLLAEFGAAALEVGDDAVFVDPLRAPDPSAILRSLALEGTPARHQVRGVAIRGVGAWTARAVLGPVAVEALEATRAREWGEVDGAGPLPPPEPRPPGVRRWLLAGLLVALLAAVLGWDPLASSASEPRHPLHRWRVGAAGLRFDVDDEAVLAVVVQPERGGPSVRLAPTDPAAKGELATGEGDYRLPPPLPPALLVASLARPLPELERTIEAARRSADPLGDLAERIRTLQPDADVRVLRAGAAAGGAGTR